jgi:glycosyltransferase involved in cell wall biosynthesis
MKISVIIPTYNEKENIEDCLESLSKQSFKDIEIVVVDDGSDDKTDEVLSKFQISNFKFQIYRTNHLGAGAARNRGATQAKGKILVFVDADMTFDKDFIKNLVAPIISGKTKGTFSHDEFVSNWDNVWSKCWNINEGWEDKKRHPKNYPNHQPVFRAILKSEFDKVGGFTPGGYDDDWSLSKKLNYEAIVAENAVFYHKNPSSLIEIFNHAKWVGKRKYKYGYIGYIFGIVRSSFPISLSVGLYKGIKNYDLRFMIFKLVYDFGVFVGILEYLTTGKSAK